MADRLLIVDDDPGVTMLCERLMRRAGYDAQSAARPLEALKLLRAQHFDLLLLDVRMPEMNGFELLRLARERDPELAILVMTGHGTVDTAVEALHNGAEGLVLKPFESGEKLVQSVRDALTKSRQARQAARSRALRPLFDVSQKLLAEVDPERLRSLIAAMAQTQFDAACVGLYSMGNGELHLAARQGPQDHYPQTTGVGPESGLPGRAVAWSLPLWVTLDVPGDEALQNDLRSCRLNSALCAPLLRHGRPMGAIVVGKAAGDFHEGDLELLTILAGQAAVALENAGLYEELRDSVRRIEDSQQQLIQAEKLAALGRLVGSIAHEVNNPLQAIQNCLHLASHDSLPEEKRGAYQQMATEEVERLINTVRQMLDFYRPTGADFVPTDLNSLLDDVLTLASGCLTDNRVTVKKLYRKSLPPVPVARNNIKQVFLNLLLNACEAMPHGGSLTLRTGLKQPEGRQTATIAFTDTGAGIAAEDQAKLFEPFFTTRARGTGLGLAVSYGIVETHGGWIKVKSAPGSGATFTVYLPLERS